MPAGVRPGRHTASPGDPRRAGSGDRPGGPRRAPRGRARRRRRPGAQGRSHPSRPMRRMRGHRTAPASPLKAALQCLRPGRQADEVDNGTRGTMPYQAYSAFEIGWALSVAVARATPSSGPAGSTWASRARPTPADWSPGSTNSIERNHSRSRRSAAATTIRRPTSASVLRLRDDEAIGIGRLQVLVESDERTGLVGDVRLRQAARVVVDRVAPDLGTGGQFGGLTGR